MKKPQEQLGDQVWKLFRLSNVEYLLHHPFAVVAAFVFPCELCWMLIPTDAFALDLDSFQYDLVLKTVFANTLPFQHNRLQLTFEVEVLGLFVVKPIASRT